MAYTIYFVKQNLQGPLSSFGHNFVVLKDSSGNIVSQICGGPSNGFGGHLGYGAQWTQFDDYSNKDSVTRGGPDGVVKETQDWSPDGSHDDTYYDRYGLEYFELNFDSADELIGVEKDNVWLVIPPILLRQFRLFYHEGKPAAVVLYARVSPEVAVRLDAGAPTLRPQDWQSGKELKVVKVIAPFGQAEQFARETTQSLHISPRRRADSGTDHV